jgi:hypothetical protein
MLEVVLANAFNHSHDVVDLCFRDTKHSAGSAKPKLALVGLLQEKHIWKIEISVVAVLCYRARGYIQYPILVTCYFAIAISSATTLYCFLFF